MTDQHEVLDIESIPLDDPKVWELICSGHTKGIFQVDSRLGKTWCKEIQPRSIEELSAVSALLRPGCLQSSIDGKSMTKHYADRNSGKDKNAKTAHPLLDPILGKTHNVLVFQEQTMAIARDVAGFNGEQVQKIRKGAGKKDAKLMASLRKEFVEGCVRVSELTESKANEIYDNIESSNRYAFNASHSVSYSKPGYWSAYLKLYHPLQFYQTWLRWASDKPHPDTEKKELIMSAKTDDIEVLGPTCEFLCDEFTAKDGKIYFGLTDIKSVGKAHVQDLRDLLTPEVETDQDLIVTVLLRLKKGAVFNMIDAGVFDAYGVNRGVLRHKLECLRKMTAKEIDWLVTNYNLHASITDCLSSGAKVKKEGGACHNTKRISVLLDIVEQLNNPGRDSASTPEIITVKEETLLGVPITYSRLSATDSSITGNTTCKEFEDGKTGNMTIACEVASFREHTTKDGGVMCFMTIEDETGEMDEVLVFADTYDDCGGNIYERAVVLLTGTRSKNKKTTFVVSKATLI